MRTLRISDGWEVRLYRGADLNFEGGPEIAHADVMAGERQEAES